MTIAMDRTSEPAHGSDASAQPWQLGIVTDVADHVHLGVVIEGGPGRPRQYVDLLAAVGAANVADVDIDHRVVIVTGGTLEQLRRIAERCLDDRRLRQQLVRLADRAASR